MKKIDSQKVYRYAIKFHIDNPTLEPSFENIEKALSVCARAPKMIWLPKIRKQILKIRQELK